MFRSIEGAARAGSCSALVGEILGLDVGWLPIEVLAESELTQAHDLQALSAGTGF